MDYLRFAVFFRIGVLRNAVNSLDVRDAKASAPADEASPWKRSPENWWLEDLEDVYILLRSSFPGDICSFSVGV